MALYISKKISVPVVLALLVIAFITAYKPTVEASPGFTLKGLKKWKWGDASEIYSVAVGNVDGDSALEIVTGGYYDDGTYTRAQLCVWD